MPVDRDQHPSIVTFKADASLLEAMEGIREIAEKGGPKNAEHTLRNVDSFSSWEKSVNEAAEKSI